MVWHTMDPNLSALFGRKAQSIQSQQAERTEGSPSARAPQLSETKLEIIIQPFKENHLKPSGRAHSQKTPKCPELKGPRAWQCSSCHTPLPDLPNKWTWRNKLWKSSFESHGAGADEELGLLPELGGMWWSYGWSPAVTLLCLEYPLSDVQLWPALINSLTLTVSESRHCQAPKAGQCLPFPHSLALSRPLPWATASHGGQDEHSPSLGHTPSDTAGTDTGRSSQGSWNGSGRCIQHIQLSKAVSL